MSGYWKLNGLELKDPSVKVIITKITGNELIHSIDSVNIHGGGEDIQRITSNKPRQTLVMKFIGRGIDKYRERNEVLESLRNNVISTLEAPASHPLYISEESRRMALICLSAKKDDEKGTASITLTLSIIEMGVWIDDGGEFFETINGDMEYTSTVPDTYTNERGETFTTQPELVVLEQSTGYPLVTRVTTFVEETPPLLGTFTTVTADGKTLTWERYNLTNYIHPTLSSVGDGGVYSAKSSPTQLQLSGGA